jgi:hypothetical protein
MFGLTGIKLGGMIAGLLAILAFVGWVVRIEHLRAEWQGKYETLDGQAKVVLLAVQSASNNPALIWRDVGHQVEINAKAHADLIASTKGQSDKINALSIEAARQKAISADASTKAEASIAQRQATIDRLNMIALTPGASTDLTAQLNAANNALDSAYGQGL